MAKGKWITSAMRQEIRRKYNIEKRTQKEIATEMGISQGAICKALKVSKYLTNKKKGRPEKLKTIDRLRMKINIKKNPKLSAASLCKLLDLDCHEVTIRRNLKRMEFNHIRIPKTKGLSKKNEGKRLEFA